MRVHVSVTLSIKEHHHLNPSLKYPLNKQKPLAQEMPHARMLGFTTQNQVVTC